MKEAEANAGEALDSLRKMYGLIDDPQFSASPVLKTVAKRNVKKIVDDVDEAKQKFENELKSANITERYWKQVSNARQAFEQELEILFPNVNIAEKKFSVDEESFDLFVLYMYQKVNNLQKELDRLQVREKGLANETRARGTKEMNFLSYDIKNRIKIYNER